MVSFQKNANGTLSQCQLTQVAAGSCHIDSTYHGNVLNQPGLTPIVNGGVNKLGLQVSVCHYPTGCSKWNPIEHRLFGPISINWAGKPLRSWETLMGYIRGTTTATGLAVRAERDDDAYPTGEKVTDAEMAALNLERHPTCPTWNYTLRPRPAAPAISSQPSGRELILWRALSLRFSPLTR